MAVTNTNATVDVAATPTFTLGFTPTIERGLCVIGSIGGDTVTVTDSAGNQYQQVVFSSALFNDLFIAVAYVASVPTQVSLNPGGGYDFGTVRVFEFSNAVNAADILDASDSQQTDGTNTSNSSPTASVTLLQAAGMIFCVGDARSSFSMDSRTFNSGFTTLDESPVFGYKEVFAVGPHTAVLDFTLTPGDAALLVVAAAVIAGGVPSPVGRYTQGLIARQQRYPRR